MKLLIVYDVCTSDPGGVKRLRRVARACQDYGVRAQKSVFECTVGDADWVRLRGRLLDVLDVAADSLRVYFLDADVRVEHHGVGVPVDLDGPLVI